MNECCKDTFKDALREVILTIHKNEIDNIHKLILLIENAISLIDKYSSKEE